MNGTMCMFSVVPGICSTWTIGTMSLVTCTDISDTWYLAPEHPFNKPEHVVGVYEHLCTFGERCLRKTLLKGQDKWGCQTWHASTTDTDGDDWEDRADAEQCSYCFGVHVQCSEFVLCMQVCST